MIERIETGVRSSKIVKHNGVAYITGQVGEGETIKDQTIECLRRLDELLIQAGSSRNKMLRATIWLADMSDFEAKKKFDLAFNTINSFCTSQRPNRRKPI